MKIETPPDWLRLAVRFVLDDASERLGKAIALPVRNDTQEETLRALLTALYAAYPEILATAPQDSEALLRQVMADT